MIVPPVTTATSFPSSGSGVSWRGVHLVVFMRTAYGAPGGPQRACPAGPGRGWFLPRLSDSADTVTASPPGCSSTHPSAPLVSCRQIEVRGGSFLQDLRTRVEHLSRDPRRVRHLLRDGVHRRAEPDHPRQRERTSSVTAWPMAQLVTATALTAAVTTLLMGVIGNVPIALAAGLGVNTHRRAPARAQDELAGRDGDGGDRRLSRSCCWWSPDCAERVMSAVPLGLRRAIAIGIGLFIILIGARRLRFRDPDPGRRANHRSAPARR